MLSFPASRDLLSPLLVALIALASQSAAQPPATGLTPGGHPFLVSVRTDRPPVIDGRLDDPAWKPAARTDHFSQVEPVEGAAPSERTELLVMHDRDNLYIGVRCHDREPAAIVATSMERDARLDPDDRVELILDTFHDQRFAYFFQTNPAGARGDGLISPGGFSKAWDGIFRSRSSVDAGGWSCEFAIPFKTVSFRPELTTWGFNLVRYIRRRNERARWSEPSQDFRIFNLAAAGELRGLVDVNPGLGLDLKPFLAASRFHDRPTGRRFSKLEPGFDAFVRLSEGLNAAFTVNTDFADTEVDTRQVNLTRFPLFFPEKRDFFLQDTSIFVFSDLGGRFGRGGDLIPFFSRRIGLSAEGDEVPLVAGAKVTGRAGPLNLGLLDVEAGARGALASENLLAGRASLNIGTESSAGLIVTHGDPTGETRNDVLGADFTYRTSTFLGDKRLKVGGYGLKTWTRGGGRKNLAYGTFLDYPNDLVRFRADFMEIQDDFDPRLGFVRRTGNRKFAGRFSLNPRLHSWIRQLSFRLHGEAFTETSSTVESARLSFTFFRAELETGDSLRLTVDRVLDRLTEPFEISERATIPPGRYSWTVGTVNLETAEYRPVSAEAHVAGGGFYSGERRYYSLRLGLRPSRYFTLSFDGEVYDVNLPEGDFITRLYGLRARVNFSPDLTWSNFLQYDNVSDTAGLQSRLRWHFQPGSDLFLVLNQGWLKERSSIVPSTQELTLKVEYTFRF